MSTVAKRGEKRVGNQSINLSDYDLLHLSFVNKEGRELLCLELDRLAEEAKPQLQFQTFTPAGDLHSSNILFDLDV